MYNRLRLSSIQTHLNVHGPAAMSVRLNHLVKSKIKLMLSLISILPFDQTMENRAEKLRSVLFVSGISWKFGHYSASFQLLVI